MIASAETHQHDDTTGEKFLRKKFLLKNFYNKHVQHVSCRAEFRGTKNYFCPAQKKLCEARSS